MRALVISELFGPTRGGTAVWFDHVYRRPEAAGSEVVTAKVPGSDAFDAVYPRTVHRSGWRRHRWLRPESAAIYAGLLARVARLAGSGRFEAIHAGRVLPEGLIAVVVGRWSGLPVLIYAHGEEITGWREPFKRATMQWAYRRADAVIANSPFTRDLLVELGVGRERIAIIHPGVDAARYSPEVDGSGVRRSLGIGSARLVLSVGRLQARKGFDRVIAALPTVTRRVGPVHYVVVGAGEDEKRLRSLAFEHHVADRVHFAGEVPEGELPVWYAACDAFAMPNRDIDGDTEGFGMVFLEAAASGKCALAGLEGGTGFAVVSGRTGLRVPGRNVAAVAEGLIRLLSSPEASERMGRLGRQRVLRGFTWEKVACRTRRLHEALVSARGSGNPIAAMGEAP